MRQRAAAYEPGQVRRKRSGYAYGYEAVKRGSETDEDVIIQTASNACRDLKMLDVIEPCCYAVGGISGSSI